MALGWGGKRAIAVRLFVPCISGHAGRILKVFGGSSSLVDKHRPGGRHEKYGRPDPVCPCCSAVAPSGRLSFHEARPPTFYSDLGITRFPLKPSPPKTNLTNPLACW